VRRKTSATNGPLFLNGVQRSVNRKVQGSNPWSGANCKFEAGSMPIRTLADTSFGHPLYMHCRRAWGSLCRRTQPRSASVEAIFVIG
jgi:hypothetical protein